MINVLLIRRWTGVGVHSGQTDHGVRNTPWRQVRGGRFLRLVVPDCSAAPRPWFHSSPADDRQRRVRRWHDRSGSVVGLPGRRWQMTATTGRRKWKRSGSSNSGMRRTEKSKMSRKRKRKKTRVVSENFHQTSFCVLPIMSEMPPTSFLVLCCYYYY